MLERSLDFRLWETGGQIIFVGYWRKTAIPENWKARRHRGYINIYWVIQIRMQVPQSLKSLQSFLLYVSYLSFNSCSYPLFLPYWKMTHFNILCSLACSPAYVTNQGHVQSQNPSAVASFCTLPPPRVSESDVFKGEEKQGRREKEDHLSA